MAYTFTPLHPPLLLDYPDLRSIPATDLKQTQGTATWTTQREIRTGDRVLSFEVYNNSFELTRSLRWLLREGPIHRAEDFTVKITETKGYRLTQKQGFEKTLELTVGAEANLPNPELPLLKLSASVRDTLKITEDIQREWHVESVIESNRLFKAGVSYYFWDLIDGFFLTKSAKTTYLLGTGRKDMGTSGPILTQANFDSVIGTHEDKDKP